MLYRGTLELGFSNSYHSGVASLLQKSGKNLLPEPQQGMIAFQNGLLDLEPESWLLRALITQVPGSFPLIMTEMHSV